MPRRRTCASLAVAATLALALAGCTPPEHRPTPTPSPTAPPVITPSGDGVLRIGTLFTMTGDAAALGAAQVAGAQLAAREIAEAPGQAAAGYTLELIHRNAAGDIAAQITEFATRGVDVVLWDAGAAAPTDAAASVTGAGLALVELGSFVHGGALLEPDEAFSARLHSADPTLVTYAGGAESYDAVVLAALAAVAAGDDGGPSVAGSLGSVAGGDTDCVSWGECRAALADGRLIGYQGVTGRRA